MLDSSTPLGANNGLIGGVKAALRLHHTVLKISVLTLLSCQTDRCYVEAWWAPMQYVQTILVGCALGRWESGLYIGLSPMRLCGWQQALHWATGSIDVGQLLAS
jgi:hypothetical protein